MKNRISNFFLTGRIQVGKSTVLNNVLNSPAFKKLSIGGFRTKPIFENESICGYALENAAGTKQDFAYLQCKDSSDVEKYWINQEIFNEFGASILEKAIQIADIILIDEVGIMEKAADKFIKKIISCLDSKQIVLGVFQQRASWFSDMLKKRSDTVIFLITEMNREHIEKSIITEIQKSL